MKSCDLSKDSIGGSCNGDRDSDPEADAFSDGDANGVRSFSGDTLPWFVSAALFLDKGVSRGDWDGCAIAPVVMSCLT